MSIVERICSIEKKFGDSIPGTVLNRILLKDWVGWGVGFGPFQGEKQWFYGKTIEEVLDKADKHISSVNEIKIYNLRRLKNS